MPKEVKYSPKKASPSKKKMIVEESSDFSKYEIEQMLADEVS